MCTETPTHKPYSVRFETYSCSKQGIGMYRQYSIENQIETYSQTPDIIVKDQIQASVFQHLEFSDENKELFIEKASFYGNVRLLKFLLFKSRVEWSEKSLVRAFENTIMVDNPEAVKLVLEKCETLNMYVVTEKMKKLALKRGNTRILKILKVDYKERPPPLPIPKHEEFPYVNLRQDIAKLIQKSKQGNDRTIFLSFDKLLQSLLLKKVHYDQECPKKCRQSSTCNRVRDVFELLDFVLGKIAKKFPIFKDVIVQMIGSLKEQTRIGAIDECDLYLMLSEKLRELMKTIFEFDREEQKIKVRKGYYKDRNWIELELPGELKPFICQQNQGLSSELYYGYFNTPKYFMTFVTEFYNVIRENPEIPGIEGLKLTTDYIPCDVCKNTENVVTTYIRCRHRHDCYDHHVLKKQNPSFIESCNCKEFSTPSLSWSKIGRFILQK